MCFLVLFYYDFLICTRTSDPVIRARNDVSTSNLKRHVSCCDGRLAPPGGRVEEFAHGSSYNKAEFRYLATLWVSQCHRPFAIVEDRPLNRMFQMLYAKVDVPSASTVSRDVKEVYNIAKKNVGKVLQVRSDMFTLTMYLIVFSSLTHREFISASMGGHLQTPSHFLVLLFTKFKTANFSHIF